jgi:hypothetical protein
MSLASDIYDALYDLAIVALNPGWSVDPTPVDPELPWTDGTITAALPPIPVLKDQQAEAAPVPGVYVTIQGTPSLQRLGTVEHGSQAVDDSRNLDQLYVGDVVLWEVNGDGSSLHEIFAFSDTEEGMAIMDASPVSIMSYGDVVDMGMTLENRWIPQSRATISVSIKARNSETLSTIAEVHWANAENPANSGSVEYPTV